MENGVIPEVGSRVEDASLRDSTGQLRSLSEIAAGRTLVVIFYRGAW
ncbi:MAG: hypothetical protein ACK47B_14330 [Armatimonadota bacterium]